ncbi:MAG: VCBS repeat-containing protein, partial [Candidatus Fermentibacteria bacterium]|nr:VCBS repeat-containing protein [Candidatus Fermentibacteria bacterium]
MKGKMLLAVLAAFSVSAYSDILVQEDWTGGEGIWGPVIEWGSVFFESAGVTYSEPGEVHLDYLYSEDQIAGNFQGAYELREADIDGDGDLDIVCAASIADKIKWWENIDGTGGSWQGHLIAGNLNMACSVDCADVDGDGDTDILSSNNGGTMGNMRWWENTDGTGSSWTEHSMGEEYWAGGGISAGDPDGDGDQDILTSYVMDDKIV